MRLRQIVLGFMLTGSLGAAPVLGGEPVTATGIDLVVGDAQAAPGENVSLAVRFVAGSPDAAAGGPDEIASLQFTIDFTGLDFDTTDRDPEDGVPDAIVFNPDALPELTFFAPIVLNPDTAADDGFLEIIITDPTRTHTLPNATLLQVSFRIPSTTTSTTIPVHLSDVLAKDTQDVAQAIDEAVDGTVTVLPPTTASIVPTATATPTGTSPLVVATTTPVFTRTPRATATAAPPTFTPPPGCSNFAGSLVCSHGENGDGCSIGASHVGAGSLAILFIPPAVWRRASPRR
ncbi:MAG TPA: cohesin domain-containing protein [Candidatus Kryptonia bacterium]|nr:cohesin domain-containing protein [Candidatus Kryptonia bacterium]